MPELSLDEIINVHQFEELAAVYFRRVIDIPGTGITNVEKPPGFGTDGGRDILVEFGQAAQHNFECAQIQPLSLHNAAIARQIRNIRGPALAGF